MFTTRLSQLSFTIIACFIIILGRLFYWQIWKSPELKEKAQSQTYKQVKIDPIRGLIYTADNYPIVQNQTSYLLSIYKPNLTIPLNDVITKIDQTGLSFFSTNQNLLNKFTTDIQQKWLTFPTNFSSSQSASLKIAGLSFQPNSSRFYPENDLFQPLLGYIIKNDDGNNQGTVGLEGYYQKQLEGKPGYYWQTKDANGNPILTSQNWKSEVIDGRNLHTSLDRNVQYLVEQELSKGIRNYQADQGSAIVLNPQTGQIIAMASINATPSATRNFNPVIFDQYEPGSIFKPLVVTAALDNGAITTGFICPHCDQPRAIDQYTINNWNNEIHPNSTLRDIIKNSDNIGMSYVIDQLGVKNFLSYYRRLGLTSKTGIDLEGESLPPVKEVWPSIDLATASFGQGIAITQIQMIRAFNAIANNGFLVQPSIVDYLTEGNNTIPRHRPLPVKIFNDQSIAQIKQILQYAVENGAVAKLKPDNLEVCAKSGTAQIAIKGGYTDDKTIASYIGFSPCNNPKFTMIITINNPRTSPWGASTAAPIWYTIAQKLYFFL